MSTLIEKALYLEKLVSEIDFNGTFELIKDDPEEYIYETDGIIDIVFRLKTDLEYEFEEMCIIIEGYIEHPALIEASEITFEDTGETFPIIAFDPEKVEID